MDPKRSLERDLLEVLAYFGNMEYLVLTSRLEDWRESELEYDAFSEARENLVELGLIRKPDYGSRFDYQLTERGWDYLGGETPFNE